MALGVSEPLKDWESVTHAVALREPDSVDEVVNKLKENAKLVEGHGIDTDPVNAIDIVKDVIKEGEKIGIKF